MIYGARSDRELKYAKAKAKATEFFVDPVSIPHFKLNSDELHYTSVLSLSAYVNARMSGDDGAKYLPDLQKTGSFYDAASNDGSYREFSDGYWTLAMAAYFLLGNYGSAKVCTEKVSNADFYGKSAETLHAFIRFLLVPDRPVPSSLPVLADYLRGGDASEDEVIKEASGILTHDNPEDEFFSGILYVSIIDAISNSSRRLLPIFSNLGTDKWRQYLSSRSASRLLWQAQRQIGQAGVFAGESAFIQLPTGSGKTKSIEMILRSRMLAEQCHLAVVVAPLRALCSEITRSLSIVLKGVARVRQASDVMEIDSWFMEASSSHEVVVFTPEKLGFVIHHNPSFLIESDLFVFDEAHLLDSESRGPGYELLLTEIFRSKPNAQKILISAVVSNADEIAQWAFSDSSRVACGEHIQVTEKSLALIKKNGKRVSYVSQDNLSCEEYFVMVDAKPQELKLHPSERKRRFFPNYAGQSSEKARDQAIYYANRLLPNGACAIYIPRKASLRPMYKRLADLVQRKADLSNLRSSITEKEKKALESLVCKHYGVDNFINIGISSGVLPHYGDLQGSIRQAVEYEIEQEIAKCVVCTSTLAEGVNLPIKYLIITGARKGHETPQTRDFQNLIGRAARSGKYSEGSVLITDNTDASKQKTMYSALLKKSNTERCESAIVNLLSDAVVQGTVIPGGAIVDLLLKNMDNPQLEHGLSKAFSRRFKCDIAQARELARKRMRPLEAIESYLAGFIATNTDDLDVTDLCISTYAYTSSNEATRRQLIELFQKVYDSLSSVNKRRAALYHMMQLGVRTASLLIDWTESTEGRRFIEGGCSEIELAVRQFLDASPVVATQLNVEQLSTVIRLWIDGKDLRQITDEVNAEFNLKKALQISQIEKTVSGIVRFSFAHFISCVLDVVRQSEVLLTENNIENLTSFQRKVKYGVSTLREALICEEVIDDRMIAKEIISIIGKTGQSLDVFLLKLEAQNHREEIEQYANSLPEYCAGCILDWIKV